MSDWDDAKKAWRQARGEFWLLLVGYGAEFTVNCFLRAKRLGAKEESLKESANLVSLIAEGIMGKSFWFIPKGSISTEGLENPKSDPDWVMLRGESDE